MTSAIPENVHHHSLSTPEIPLHKENDQRVNRLGILEMKSVQF